MPRHEFRPCKTAPSYLLKISIVLGPIALALAGCVTATPGSITTSTYFDESKYSGLRELGSVSGESCQTRLFYYLPKGKAPSTAEAIADAKAKFPDTVFLADVTVETRVKWGIGFSKVCTVVTAIAYTASGSTTDVTASNDSESSP